MRINQRKQLSIFHAKDLKFWLFNSYLLFPSVQALESTVVLTNKECSQWMYTMIYLKETYLFLAHILL